MYLEVGALRARRTLTTRGDETADAMGDAISLTVPTHKLIRHPKSTHPLEWPSHAVDTN